MRLWVASDHRFGITPDGGIYSLTGTHGYAFWQRYLDVFDDVRVIARCRPIEQPRGSLAAGPGIEFERFPDVSGPVGIARNRALIRRYAERIREEKSPAMLRPPGPLSPWFSRLFLRFQVPYGVEVTSDPRESLARGANKLLLRPMYQRFFIGELKRICDRAVCVSYVNRSRLPKLYPAHRGRFWTHSSNVIMSQDAYRAAPREFSAGPKRIICVAGLEPYKGIGYLIDAVARVRKKRDDVELVLVGDGRSRSALEQQVARRRIAKHVHFRGRVTPVEAVREELDAADLFVLPSLGEGLPRAMIEAMGRGLPCLGTNVSGIPELLEKPELVPSRDAKRLAVAIRQLVRDPARMSELSAANLRRSYEYHLDVLRERRNTFYTHLQSAAAEHDHTGDGGIFNIRRAA